MQLGGRGFALTAAELDHDDAIVRTVLARTTPRPDDARPGYRGRNNGAVWSACRGTDRALPARRMARRAAPGCPGLRSPTWVAARLEELMRRSQNVLSCPPRHVPVLLAALACGAASCAADDPPAPIATVQ